MEFSLNARDGVKIYYTLNHADDGQSNKLIIIGHGLTGHRFEYIHQITHRIFMSAGYDVIRIAYYADAKDARKLDDCSVQTHADDLNDLISHVKNDYSKVFYAGHSYGGLTALLANPDVNATAFWDATYIPNFWDSEASYIPELDCYKIGWGTNSLASRVMYEESKYLTHDVMLPKAQSFKSPALVVLAGNNTDPFENRDYLIKDLSEPKSLFEISNATHCFLEVGTSELLAEKTLEWFKKYS